MAPQSDITLQINLSPGDISYANLTVPELVRLHRSAVREVVGVVDVCKPGRTKAVDPEVRFPEPTFSERVEKIIAIAEGLKSQGVLDRLVVLRPGNEIHELCKKKYLRNLVSHTHDWSGCALTAYLSAFEVVDTKYLLHYDADMLLYQAPGREDWSVTAKRWIESPPAGEEKEFVVAASPRHSPPFVPQGSPEDLPERVCGVPTRPVPGGWLDNWFSTRCFLIHRPRLFETLPLLRGRVLIEHLARVALRKSWPLSPEVMMHHAIGRAQKGRRLLLGDQDVWLLHPAQKPAEYLALLPAIMDSIRRGVVPEGQRGYANIALSLWQEFLAKEVPAAQALPGKG